MNNSISVGVLIPSNEHIKELRDKGIDVESELERVVYDALNLIQKGEEPLSLGISITKTQLDDLKKFGIDGVRKSAFAFKNELHRILENKKE